MFSDGTRADKIGGALLPMRLTAEHELQSSGRLEQTVTELYDQLHATILRHVICLRVPPADADDIVQDAFLRVYDHLSAGGDRSNLRGWLFRVAHNLALDRMKRDARLVHVEDDVWAEFTDQLGSSSQNPEERLVEKELAQWFHQKMSALPEQQRYCLFLRAEGLRYREIAETLGVTVQTVASYLRRAIGTLTEAANE